jgi:hypothetical protein
MELGNARGDADGDPRLERRSHNLPLQMFETTGLLGGVAFLAVAAHLVAGLAHAPDERRWMVASAAVVGLGSLYEPLCLSVTPLFFLFAAASHPEPAPERPAERARPRGARIAVVAALGLALAVATLALDGRAGDAAAAAEARSTIAGAVELHPWDPNVRLVASDVERLLRDFPAARD